MNRPKGIANPVVVFALICAFIYIYFFYLRGANPISLLMPSASKETERTWEDVPPKDPNAVALAGPVDQPQVPINSLNQQNVVQRPNPLETPQGNPGTTLPAGPDQNAPLQPIAPPDLTLTEGHWIGLEVIPLTAAIAEANSIPPDVTGALIDEVTLLSAEAGLFAGDVITAVNGKRVTNLKSFHLATQVVAQSNRADVSVYRGGQNKNIVVFSTVALGGAQMEGAPMILPTSKSPHGYYGPCDRCHAIAKIGPGTGNVLQPKNALNPNELLKDQGDSLKKVAPNIRAGTPPPHRNRGTCTKCHVVI
jgi:membrane-associated protease RseP (regulator of RpoE activity)